MKIRDAKIGGTEEVRDMRQHRQPEHFGEKPPPEKLGITKPGDESEREAERVADRFVGQSEPQAAVSELRSVEEPAISRRPANLRATADRAAPPIVQEVLSSPGKPLDPVSRAFFEPRFGRSFADVRLHTDAKAAQSAEAVAADAYTVGSHVAFGGQDPSQTAFNRRLMAHELAHVVQQTESGVMRLARSTTATPTTRKHQVPTWTRSSYTIPQLQKNPDHPSGYSGDTLGSVAPINVPTDERAAVAEKIADYFDEGGVRNAEVDVIVEVSSRPLKHVLYTLRFGEENSVEVERLGVKGKSPELTFNLPDIARIPGYDSVSGDVEQFRGWIRKRYPTIQPAGETVAEIRDNLNQTLDTKSKTREWFWDAYKIRVRTKSAAKGSLVVKEILTRGALTGEALSLKERLTGISDFLPDELRNIEVALELFSPALLKTLEGTSMVRQKVDPAGGPYAAETRSLSRPVIFVYDSMFTSLGNPNEGLFSGSARRAHSPVTESLAHELGHVVQGQDGINSTFLALARRRSLTDYAERDWQYLLEEFPEALALYLTDPEWVESNYPDIFAWFEELSRTGRKPD